MLPSSNVHPVIAIKDVEESREFYEKVLGLELLDQDEGGIMYKSGNTKIFVYPSEFAGTNKATSAMWQVEEIEECVSELKRKGMKFEHYDFPGVERKGDLHIMGKIKSAWFKDPTGNILNITNFA